MEIADRHIVLRDGRQAGGGAVKETSIDAIIRMMVGREVSALYARRAPQQAGEVALRVEGPLPAGRRPGPERHRSGRRQLRGPSRRDPGDRRAGGRRPDRDGAQHLRRRCLRQRANLRRRARRVDIRSPRDAIRHGIGPGSGRPQAAGLVPVPGGEGQSQHGGARTHWPLGSLHRRQSGTGLGRGIPPAAQHPHGEPGIRRSSTSPAATSRRWCWRAGWRFGPRC